MSRITKTSIDEKFSNASAKKKTSKNNFTGSDLDDMTTMYCMSLQVRWGFASRAKAQTPAAIGAEALVPVCWFVQIWSGLNLCTKERVFHTKTAAGLKLVSSTPIWDICARDVATS